MQSFLQAAVPSRVQFRNWNLKLKPETWADWNNSLEALFDTTSFILKLIKTIMLYVLEQKDFVFLRLHLKSERI